MMQTADLAAAPLTQNVPRKDVVEFIDPAFMEFGLAILMRKRDKSSEIRNMESLGKQTKVKFACVRGGATANFFLKMKHSKGGEYTQQWNAMENRLVGSIEEGVRKVRESTDSHPFAFIGEHPTLDYHASREPCDLVTVLSGIDREDYKGEYHLAFRKAFDAAKRTKLAENLQAMKDSGRLDQLYDKWWKERDQCSRSSTTSPAVALASGAAFLVPIVVAVLFRGSGE